MNILNIAYPFSPVAPNSAGGAEQVLRILDEAIIEKGFNSMVIGHELSQVSGKLFSVPFPGEDDINKIKDASYTLYRSLIQKVLVQNKIDLIHMHGVDFYEYLPETDIPILVTVHLPPEWYPEEAFDGRSNIYFNCVSLTQQEKMGYNSRLLPYIQNGIKTDEFKISDKKQDYALCLGRICWEKGFHIALQAAGNAGIPIYIAGEIYDFESHREYFRESIQPYLDGVNSKHIEHITPADKKNLLANAKCLLAPSLVEETSSLAAMEALASGTPVIAFNIGALPEIIDDSRTGYIVNNAEEMTESIRKINRISAHVCRSEAVNRFSAKDMTGRYIALYNSLINKKELMFRCA
jgi:glycosyltransferase involved in cell wall biosynthesis